VGQFDHEAAVTLHFMYYNFCRIHKTLRVAPAMEAGIAGHVWEIDELVALMEPKSILDGLKQVIQQLDFSNAGRLTPCPLPENSNCTECCALVATSLAEITRHGWLEAFNWSGVTLRNIASNYPSARPPAGIG
jgi:hypothetical protein